MESVGFNDRDLAVIKEGLESIVEKKGEECADVLCMAYKIARMLLCGLIC